MLLRLLLLLLLLLHGACGSRVFLRWTLSLQTCLIAGQLRYQHVLTHNRSATLVIMTVILARSSQGQRRGRCPCGMFLRDTLRASWRLGAHANVPAFKQIEIRDVDPVDMPRCSEIHRAQQDFSNQQRATLGGRRRKMLQVWPGARS